MKNVSWDLVRSFLALMREGSLAKAARSAGASQPSLGRHIKQLEEQLGVPLFERRSGRLMPTPFAHRLAEASRAMESGASAITALLDAQHAERTRTVRISASRTVATHLLPPLLAPLMDENLHIELLSEDELSNLAGREADVAVRLVPPTQASLIARRVGTMHFGMYAARSYLRRKPPPKTLRELAEHTTIGFDRSPMMQRALRKLGITAARSDFRFHSDDRVVHWAAVRAGVGLGLLATYYGEQELVRVLPQQRFGANGVWLVGQREVLARPHVREVFVALRDGISAQLAAAPR